MCQVLDQFVDGRLGAVDRGRRRRRLAVITAVNDTPDPPALAVAAGVSQRHLVMADDLVVEVGDVEGAVGAELDVDRVKPVVLAPDEVSLLRAPGRRPMPLDAVVVDAVGHHVADERGAAIRLGVLVGRVEADAADPGRAVIGVDHLGAKAHAVVGLAKAGVISPPQELVERLAVAVA